MCVFTFHIYIIVITFLLKHSVNKYICSLANDKAISNIFEISLRRHQSSNKLRHRGAFWMNKYLDRKFDFHFCKDDACFEYHLSCIRTHFVSRRNSQYNTIQYNTIQYNTIQCNAIQYNTMQYNTIQYNVIQCNTIQYNTMQYNTIQCNTIQYN